MPAAPYITTDDLLADSRWARLRAMDPTQLADYVAQFEDIAERFVSVAFTPRDFTWVTTIMRGRPHELDTPHINLRSVTSITTDDVLPDTLWTVDLTAGRIRFRHGWQLCIGDQVTVVYSHGLDAPPPPILQACRRFVTNEASADLAGTSRNIIGQNVDGSYIRYSTPDWEAGRPTGWLDVDNILDGYRHSTHPILVA